MRKALLRATLACTTVTAPTVMADQSLTDQVIQGAEAVHQQAIEWRHDVHQHPELGNQEHRTAKLVADHLRKLGMEVQTEVGTTGVVGILKGGLPGPVVGLRADMDALPVKERTGLPYASEVIQKYQGENTHVMHACGHDAHVAILMSVAQNLANVRDQLPGTVKFIFQPAEEGPSDYVYQGEQHFGARLMVEEGVLKNPGVDAIFGLHVTSKAPTGIISYRSGPTMASSSDLYITVKGEQTHGAQPWDGVDPIVTSAQIINGLQTVVSRKTNIMPAPAVVTIGTIDGGSRHNIIPDSVKMSGTIRTFDDDVQRQVNEHVTTTTEHIAQASGAEAAVSIVNNYATTVNDPALTQQMLPTLKRVAPQRVFEAPLVTGSEDFSYYAKEVPGLFFFLGVTPMEDMKSAAPNHSPKFYVDDKALVTGIKALSALTSDYLQSHRSQRQ
ncbi:amidohydrolase [Marinobacter sp. NP-4(2019)]|uniref:amidohydrolase n=1 Tax=Marinobacter sp. NP-4(2019) TaxID=2488665 RepID=UPI000FC3F1DC|nr:amidohydrolase [Marinobacter sp. NP-4(2019)]AZT82542.1 amidohydrolase [Marinobacter sp. NP-4(2019)]